MALSLHVDSLFNEHAAVAFMLEVTRQHEQHHRSLPLQVDLTLDDGTVIFSGKSRIGRHAQRRAISVRSNPRIGDLPHPCSVIITLKVDGQPVSFRLNGRTSEERHHRILLLSRKQEDRKKRALRQRTFEAPVPVPPTPAVAGDEEDMPLLDHPGHLHDMVTDLFERCAESILVWSVRVSLVPQIRARILEGIRHELLAQAFDAKGDYSEDRLAAAVWDLTGKPLEEFMARYPTFQ